ncbi:hypothetical protein [Planomonospora parontospora]|uniref:hypothetical protein n=1 Tax=Planomonospora parontospora TaxID=58119 RepID=UPI0016702BB6|nr:hypothetical protein [Planomonospora parontospora]GGL25276.1 hypothetical protein GCM10014719_28690 [Planomonospora parontospora subsp. antibiotica]GII16354.1 hypothetical protein Ppa05_30800 [Planomonospora parontospora subsp. antibiotica]
MSHPVTRFTAAALAAALGGTLLQTPAAAAGPAAPSASVTAVAPVLTAAAGTSGASAAAKPRFTASVRYDKYVRRGGYVTYRVKVTNKGGYRGQAYALLGGSFPSGTRRIKVVAKPRSISCKTRGRTLNCWITSLDDGDTTSVTVRAWLRPAKRGRYVPKFGVAYTADHDADRNRLFRAIRFKKLTGTRIL